MENKYKINVTNPPVWDIAFKDNTAKDPQQEIEYQKAVANHVSKEALKRIKQTPVYKNCRFNRLKGDMTITLSRPEKVNLKYYGSTTENFKQFVTDLFGVYRKYWRAVYEEVGRRLEEMPDEGALEAEASTQGIPDFGITLPEEGSSLNLQESEMEDLKGEDNNPIVNIDPNRTGWKDKHEEGKANELKKSIDTKIKGYKKDIAKYETKILTNPKNKEKYMDLIEDIKDRISNLEQSIKDIDFLGADQENKYAFLKTTGGKHTVWKSKESGVVIIETSDEGFSIHEITHIRQSLEAGGLKFSKKDNKLLNSGSSAKQRADKEVEAYKMQHSYNGSFSGSTFLKGINYKTVGNIQDENHKLVYPEIYNLVNPTSNSSK